MRRAAHDDAARQLDMRARKLGAIGRAARALQDADQVDHGVAPGEQLIERGIVVHVGFDHIDGRQRDQVCRPPRGVAPAP